MSSPLNKTQLEILRLLKYFNSEQDLLEIKSLLIAYLANQVTVEADKAFNTKHYTLEVFEKWKVEHFRRIV